MAEESRQLTLEEKSQADYSNRGEVGLVMTLDEYFDGQKTSEKHYPGKHEQARHGWRFGANRPLSKLRKQRTSQGESEWDEYKKRARQRSGDAPAKSKPKKKTIWHEFDDEDRYDAHDSFHKDSKWGEWVDKLTPQETHSLKQYISVPYGHKYYKDINGRLRAKQHDPDGYSETDGYIREIDNALEKGSLHKDMVLWRGITSPSLYQGLQDGSVKVGDIIPDRGYQSTSPTKGTATNPYFLKSNAPVLYKIKAKKGQPGGYLSWGKKIGNPYMHESEFLLPRGSQLKIDGISFQTINGVKTAVLDMIIYGTRLKAIFSVISQSTKEKKENPGGPAERVFDDNPGDIVIIREGKEIKLPRTTNKHLSGKHDQASHGYRFGKTPSVSRARTMRQEGTWGDYIQRARSRQGGLSKAEQRRDKKVSEAKGRIKSARDSLANTRAGFSELEQKYKEMEKKSKELLGERDFTYNWLEHTKKKIKTKKDALDKAKGSGASVSEIGMLDAELKSAEKGLKKAQSDYDKAQKAMMKFGKTYLPTSDKYHEQKEALKKAEMGYLAVTSKDRSFVMRANRRDAARVRNEMTRKSDISSGALDKINNRQLQLGQDLYKAVKSGDKELVAKIKKQKDELEDQWFQIFKKRGNVAKGLIHDEPAQITPRINKFGNPTDMHLSTWETGTKAFSDFVGRNSLIEKDPPEIGFMDRRKNKYGAQTLDDGRAYYYDGEIYLSRNGVSRKGQTTLVHEMGHALENRDPAIRAEVMRFYRRRTKNSPTTNMKELYPNGGYDSQEVTKPDDFLPGLKDFPTLGAYAGRVYKTKDTEILSIGLELFYEAPVAFAKSDPDFFDFIYSVVRMGG